MHEPAFINQSPFFAQPVPFLDRGGRDCRVVVVKASYGLQAGELSLAEEQRPIRFGDELWGDPEVPDIKYPADLCETKPGTDVAFVAQACAPAGHQVRSMDVQLQVADRRQVLHVVGPRNWERGLSGRVLPGQPQPFQAVPLSWGNAWGGSDHSKPEKPKQELRNPVGSGVARSMGTLIGTPAYQIESPRLMGGDRHQKATPIGCAPIGRSFEPRRKWAGTYDDAWLNKVYPAKPKDYNDRFENCAGPDWWFETPLEGGEPVGLTGVTPEGMVQFRIPRVRVVIDARIDGELTTQRPPLDTVLIDTIEGVVELVWRATFVCPAKLRDRFTLLRVKKKDFR